MYSPYLWCEELYSDSLKKNYLDKLFEIFLHEGFVCLPHLLIYSFLSISKDS